VIDATDAISNSGNGGDLVLVLVEVKGLEPSAYGLQSRRSSS
jgi:hypothetical protein